ncbi:MAG: L-threonylcarbamoyladenylate synthase [Bdellovibrionales bacterium]
MKISVESAVKILLQDQVVALPTETVYGLAGRIDSEKALHLIFSTKQRPFFDPLIVHVRDKVQAQELTLEWTPIAEALANAFWPGPLTLVLRKSARISDLITSGLERVGLRCPNHPLALEVLEKLGEPFAAPSANLFGRTSPTTAEHVESEFQGKVPVLDGGPCPIGIESTVVLLDQTQVAILRKGHIKAQDIESVLKSHHLEFQWKTQVSALESPGHMKHHYMPAKPLFWVEGSWKEQPLLEKLNNSLRSLPQSVEGVQLRKPTQIRSYSELVLPDHAEQAARLLYSELRRLSSLDSDCLVFFVRKNHLHEDWDAILERLRKASAAQILSS